MSNSNERERMLEILQQISTICNSHKEYQQEYFEKIKNIMALIDPYNNKNPLQPQLTFCPFCGGRNINLLPDINSWFVKCNDCHASGGTEKDKIKAIKLWNQRVLVP